MKKHHLHIAVVSFILFDENGRLLFASPNGKDNWRVLGGMMENESVVECLRREISEELSDIDFTFYDVLDVHTFDHPKLGPIISIWTLVQYNSGKLTPSDDIAGYTLGWFTPEELTEIDLTIPRQFEFIQKAIYFVDLYLKNPHLPFLKYKWPDYAEQAQKEG